MLFSIFKFFFTHLRQPLNFLENLYYGFIGAPFEKESVFKVVPYLSDEFSIEDLRILTEKEEDIVALFALGLKETKNNNFEKAITLLDLSARYGCADAALVLGGAYYEGTLSLKVDLKIAEKYFLIGSKLGHALCQAVLARHYYEQCEFTKAFEYAHLASLKGDVEAEKLLSFLKLFFSNKRADAAIQSARLFMTKIEHNKKEAHCRKVALEGFNAAYYPDEKNNDLMN